MVFYSRATNFAPGLSSRGFWNVYVRDRTLGSTEIVSVDSAGAYGNQDSFNGEGGGISKDARYVSFMSFASNLVPNDTNRISDVFVHDRTTGVTERVSISTEGQQGDGVIWGGAMSADGRFVVFESPSNRLTLDADDDFFDVFA